MMYEVCVSNSCVLCVFVCCMDAARWMWRNARLPCLPKMVKDRVLEDGSVERETNKRYLAELTNAQALKRFLADGGLKSQFGHR